MRQLVLLVLGACTGPTFDVVPQADESTIERIDRGVLFVDASWSVPSMRARGALETLIADVPIQLVIADIDQSPALERVPALTGRLTGSGESVWVKGGAICLVCTQVSCMDDGLAAIEPTDLFAYARTRC